MRYRYGCASAYEVENAIHASTSPRNFSAQPHRAHDVITIIARAHRAIDNALAPYARRPSRQVRERVQAVLKEFQFFPMYLDGMSMSGLDGALDDASGAIAALDADVAHDRGTMAGRFAQWLHFRRHSREYTVLVAAPTRSGKGVATIIPTLLGWHGPVQIIDRKANPDTMH
ncbi:type IV secretory system conjugative DNA transfer family protein [Sphingomonas sp. UYEF23]|uniref:type IV secretory system conjugative DNA transfer family protein n=1 Tax=Sphingomonas sp. UYEF23 TaxID=1756408 RepID=UPI00339308C4